MKIENITLDSNVFRNQSFIDWLSTDFSPHKIHYFPLIAYIEVLVWYEMSSLTREDLDDDLKQLKTRIIPFSLDLVDKLMYNIRNTKQLPFRQHARDFLLGTISEKTQSILISHYKKHFKWLENTVFTPEEYVRLVIDSK